MGRRRRIGAPALLAALLLALAPTTAAAAEKNLLPGIGANDRRLPVESTAWPWAAIGRLNTSTGRHCTATLIAPDEVVTAAHCIHDPRTGLRVRPSTLHFLAGYQRGRFVAHALGRAIRVAASAGPEAAAGVGRVARDWAIVTLDAPLAIRPIAVRTFAPQPEQEGGAQTAKPESRLGESLLRAGYSQDRPHLLSVHDGCRIKDRLAGGAVWLTDCDATRGDSGSPVLAGRGAALALVGITAAVVDGGARTGTLVIPAAAFTAARAP
jgi:protease YdgD